MKTLSTTLTAFSVVCLLQAQNFNLDHYHVDIANEASVNSKHSEFGMVKSVEGNYMFTSDRNKFNSRNVFLDESSYKLYHCTPGAEAKVRPLTVNYDPNVNQGPSTPVQNNAFYFTSTNRKATLNWMAATKTNMLTISKAVLVDGQWKVEVIKEFKSKHYSYGQPSISKDGKTLFFASNMDGGHGESDLYVSRQTDEGWTEPENLGPAINTSRKDMYPYIHESGILFFASQGHDGFGGLDLYMTYQTESGWAAPENLGNPINTPADDFSLYFDEYLESGYFASNREGGMGGDDIYRIQLTSAGDNPVMAADAEVEAATEETAAGPTKAQPIIPTTKTIDARASLEH